MREFIRQTEHELEAEVEVKPPAGGRAHQLSYLTLGEAVADDAALKARVDQLVPGGLSDTRNQRGL